MAAGPTPTTPRRRIAAELIDSAVVALLTAPLWTPKVSEMIKQWRTDREREPVEPASPPSREAVVRWLVRPRNPVRRTDRVDWTMYAVGAAYECLQQMLYGRTLGQRVMDLRTVTWPDGTRPGWRMLLRRGSVQMMVRSVPAGLLIASLPVRCAWMVIHPERTWWQVAHGVVVVDDDAVTVSRHR